MRLRRCLSVFAVAAVATLVVGACGSADAPAADRPALVVTTDILGDVVREVVGDEADVTVLMPSGVSPHDFQPSAQQVEELRAADAVIANGAGLEEGLIDVLESAAEDGVPVFEAATAEHDPGDVETGQATEDAHADEHADEKHADEKHANEHADEKHADEHADEKHADEHDHAHGEDAHFFTSPERMSDAVRGLLAFLSEEVEGIDMATVNRQGSAYLEALEKLDEDVRETLASIPETRRIIVTNHDVLADFAERYDLEVVGTVLPSTSTSGSTSAQRLAELADLLKDRGVPAVFTDVSSSDRLAKTLAAEVPDVEVVALHTESLGKADDVDTYLEMIRSNADRIAKALA